MRGPLDTAVPIVSLLLTPQHLHAHTPQQEFFHEHFHVKEAEAAVACV